MPSPSATVALIKDRIKNETTGTNKNRLRFELYEPFKQLPLLNASVLITDTAPTLAQMALRFRANRDFELNGVSVADADQAFDAGGGIAIATRSSGASANDNVYWRPHLDTLQSVWAATSFASQYEPWAETVMRSDNSTTTHLRFGLFEDTTQPADLASTGSDDNAAFFLFDEDQATSATNWICVVNVSGADTLKDSGVAFQAAKETKLEIRLDSSRRPNFYINDALVYVGPAMKSAVTLIPMGASGTDAASAKASVWKYVRASMLTLV